MKRIAFALALSAAPAVASAQVAAGVIPNTFEPQPASAAAASPRPPQAEPSEPANAKAEETLRDFISGAQNANIDYSVMTDDLAAKIRAQSDSVTEVMEGLGPVRAVDWMGSMEGADLFIVAFDHGATEWLIGFTPDGQVAALLFRPAEPPQPQSDATP